MRKIWCCFLLCVMLIVSSNTYAQDGGYREVLVITQDDFVHCVDWHPTENKIATASGNSIYIWDVETGELLQSFEAYHGDINYVDSVVWSPDGTRLVSTCDHPMNAGCVPMVWDVETESAISHIDLPAYSVSWSPDGERLLMITELVSPHDLKDNHPLLNPYPLDVFSIWSPETGEADSYYSFAINRHPGWTHSQNNPSHALWLSNSEFWGINQDGEVTIWNADTRQLSRVFLELNGDPFGANQGVDWNPHTHQVAVAINDNRSGTYGFSVLGIDPEEVVAHIESPEFVDAVAWRPDGQLLATGGNTNAIRLWDASTLEELAIIPHNAPVWSSSWSPDGRYLATAEWGNPGTIRIWEITLP